MNEEKPSKPSFSPGSRWSIGLDLVIRTLLVIAVVGMVNYLATRFYHRFYLSSQTQMELSSRTLAVLSSVTNHVDVTLYYDRMPDDAHPNFYQDVLALLNEYRAANKNISIRTVDYVRDPGQAEVVKAKYRQYFGSQSDKDLVIFDSAGRVKVFPGDLLIRYKSELTGSHPRADNSQTPELEFERKPVAFNGQQAFTSILLALANPQPLKAYFLFGQGERSLSGSDNVGYQKFAEVLGQNYVSVTNFDWGGSTPIPMDCNLLIIAGPTTPFDQSQLQQIAAYLREGGRLLVLFNYAARGPTGLEGILQSWGVGVMDDIVQDFKQSTTSGGYDMIVDQFRNHPVVSAISERALQIYLPHPIVKLPPAQTANAPEVDELFATSPGATLMANRSEPPHQYPLACAVEQKPVAGQASPRGNTRIVVVGDSTFLGNLMIDSGGNRDFLISAVNWLCDRPLLLAGIGPRPVTDFRLDVSKHQERQLTWLLLGVLPGAVLAVGWLVWMVRRR
jgi:ABC-type uncharacterized transport system involved in gliding motility auxiliary subunit